MAVFGRGLPKFYQFHQKLVKSLIEKKHDHYSIVRPFASYLSRTSEHNANDYAYEITSDPREWKCVERILPLKTVPEVTTKSSYPSGWRPPSDERYKHPYCVLRNKNHMLPVHLSISNRGQTRYTVIKQVHGDLWQLYTDLKNHLEEIEGRISHSFVNEGNLKIYFRGDHVYYVEQFLLGKGF